MAFHLVRVALFGRDDPSWLSQIVLRSAGPKEAAAFDIRAAPDDTGLARTLADFRPQVIVSLGDAKSYPRLWAAPLEIRRRWINIDDPNIDPAALADRIMAAYVANATHERFEDQPLVSVFTPTYLTGPKIERPFRSLQAQTYPNWEWVIYDDSPDEGVTFEQMRQLCRRDFRITAHRADRASGNIGDVKRRACGLARGVVLVELDHDDELTPNALGWVVEASRAFPDAGFFYTDCAEVFESGGNASYGDNWGMGFGGYRKERLNGHEYMVALCPSVNAKTIRHIVGVPNHLRAWTREAYHRAGGHNPEVHVCDDYELILRTFLTTRMVHIQKFGYIQYHNNASSGNTQRLRNAEIQRLVKYFRARYNEEIHQRFVALGVEDFLWREGADLDWSVPNPAHPPIANYRFS